MKINNLKVRRETYRGSREIFTNLNLTLNAAVNVIYGPPGSGKSTLLEVIAGVLDPYAGEIVGNEPENIRFLMQVPERQFIYGSCREELEKNCKSPEKALSMFGLPVDILELSPWCLSKGERKKLLFTELFFDEKGKTGKKNFILDDPFKDLDKEGINRVTEYFMETGSNGSNKVIMAIANRSEFEHLEEKGINFNLIEI